MDTLTVEQNVKAIYAGVPTREELQLALSCIDLTSLEGSDTAVTIQKLVEKAVEQKVAAVCVYPSLVKTAKIALHRSAIKLADVAGAFPSGQLPLHLRLEEVKYALEQGADEIDMVICRAEFLQKNYAFTLEEVSKIKEVCGNKTLKVILEIGELGTLENIELASRLAIKGGADFIKTSTGKINGNATLEGVCVMLQEIKRHCESTGKKVGIKPSGGISDGITAVRYMRLTKQLLGNEWLSPSLFRIGASRLVGTLAAEIQDVNKTGETNKINTHHGY